MIELFLGVFFFKGNYSSSFKSRNLETINTKQYQVDHFQQLPDVTIIHGGRTSVTNMARNELFCSTTFP